MALFIAIPVSVFVGFVLGVLFVGAVRGGSEEDHAREGGVTDLARSVGVLVDEPAPREAP